VALAAGRLPFEKGAVTSQFEFEAIERREPTPASAEARYSRIVKARERLESDSIEAVAGSDRLELALIETTRTEANLGLLLRGLSHMTAGVEAARASNAALLAELEGVHELLGRSHEQEMALRHKVHLLELSVDETRRNAALERAHLIEQEDLFLAELLGDHEREIVALRQELAFVRSRPRADTEPPVTEPEAPSSTRESESPAAAPSEPPVSASSVPTLPPSAPRDEEQSRVQTIPSPKPTSPVDTPRVSVGAVKLQTIQIPMPSKDREEPLPARESPENPREHAPEERRTSARYSLRGDEIAEETVEVGRLTILPPSER
jgi:hypothetical protein